MLFSNLSNILKKPIISVLMITYNRELFLSESIESILNQTYDNFEFIIYDNGSSDATPNILSEYSKKDKRIKIIKNNIARSPAEAWKYGISYCIGKYIAIMDDDNIALPTRLEKQVKYMKNHKNVDMAGTFIEIYGSDKHISWVNQTDHDMLNVLMNFYNPFCHSSIIIKKSFLEKKNLTYSISLPYSYDYYLVKEAIRRGAIVSNLPEVLLKYRIHDKSLSNTEIISPIKKRSFEDIKAGLLKRFFCDNDHLIMVLQLLSNYPFGEYNFEKVITAMEMISNENKKLLILNQKALERLILQQKQIFQSGDKSLLFK